jgi:lactate dehydrogenase-like 2-hydroxyacid dehydrogenase
MNARVRITSRLSVADGSPFSLGAVDRVYVTRRLPEDDMTRLGRFELSFWDGLGAVPADVLAAEAAGADGLLTMLTDRLDATLLGQAPELRVISQMAVGVDNIDVAECARRGILVGHTPDVLTETVADSAFALLASVVRRLPEGEREVRAGDWGEWEIFHLAGGDLHGTVLGIVGMGRIGRAVARRAAGFDMEVIYSSPSPEDVEAERVELHELLRRADHVVICTRLDQTTWHLISARELETMKPDAYLVNVSRGPVVDTDALVAALGSGRLAGVGLDVTDPEPLPADHPLLGFDRVLVVPHIGSASVRTRRAMSALAVDNLIAGLDGIGMPAPYPASALGPASD